MAKKDSPNALAEHLRLLDLSTDAILVRDANGRISYWSRGASLMYGYTNDEALGKKSHELLRTVFSEPFDRIMECLDRDGQWTGELVHTRRDGSTVTTMSRWVLDRDPEHHEIQILETNTDATERKRAEESLRHSRRRLIEAQRLAKLGDWEWDIQQDQVIWPPGIYDVFGRNRELPPPDRDELLAYYAPQSRTLLEHAITRARETGEPYQLELEQIREDGTRCWHLACGEVVRDTQRRIVKLRGTAQDITDRKRAEAELKHANDALQRLNSQLEKLVSERTAEITALADQLRELAAQLTLTEQRERQRIAKVLHDHIQQMLVAAKLENATLIGRQQTEQSKASARLVSDLIDEIIAASRSLTSELSPPVLYDAGLGPALQWLARTFLEKHDFKVEVIFNPSGEPRVEDVRIFLFDAIREILFNAVKHSRVKKAHVHCFRGKDDLLRVVVRDAGAGFDPTRIQTRETSGFGLFSIQQRIKHMGGRLEIESAPGRGSSITLVAPPVSKGTQLPLVILDQAQPSRLKEAPPRSGRIRVILADDHNIIRQGLAGLLGSEPDIEVVGEASNGAQAINMARALRPDIVVMDVSMPVLNGVEATAEIQRDMPEIKVIGLSMHEEGELSSAMRQAGAVAYVTKGGSPETLVAAIRRAANL